MPDWKPSIRPQLASLRLTPPREQEIVEELSQHLDDRWHELVAGGASEAEATMLVLDELRGGRLAPRLASLRQAHAPEPIVPGAPTGRLVGDLWQDVRYAARTLRKRPTFALAAVLTLALGIGSNAAIFAVINAVLLRPLPFAKSEQLVAIHSRFVPATGLDFPFFAMSGPEFADVASRVDALAAAAAYQFAPRNLIGPGGDAERIAGMQVTAGFFQVFGIRPVVGRMFTHEEAQGAAGCLALVAESAPGDASPGVGSTIRLDDAPCEVIGVIPRAFRFRDDRIRVWTPLRLDTADSARGNHGLSVVGRLRDDASPAVMDAQLQSLRAQWSAAFPDHYAKGHFAVQRGLHADLVGNQREALLVLGGAVVFVLLIVGVNLVALLVSTVEARRREFATRQALGADRRRLVRQLVVEALLLAGVAGVVGVGLAHGLLAGLLELYPRRLPVSQPVTIDGVTLLYTFALVVASGFIVGAVPAVRATGARLQDALRGDARTATSSRRAVAMRTALVVGQLAASVVLLVGALLLVRAYRQLQQVDLGVEPERVLAFDVSISQARQSDPAAARRTLATIEDRLASLPGVETAGSVSSLPLAFPGPPDGFAIEGRPAPPPGAPGWNARYLMVTPRLFRALGMTLKRGRLIGAGDAPGTPLVALVNETAARLYWPGEDPIGKMIRYYPTETNPAIRIVGVVGDVRSLGAGAPAPAAVYAAFAQAPRPDVPGRTMTFTLRTAGDPAAVVASARAAVASVDAQLPLANVRPMADVVAATTGEPRFTSLVMSFFAGVAFLLAGLGLYGVLALAVEQRTREIGVRIALGATRHEIFRLIVGRGLALALFGVVLGVPAALGLTHVMRGMLSGLAASDPVAYVAVGGLLAVAALLAGYLPARRAMRVDPLLALKSE